MKEDFTPESSNSRGSVRFAVNQPNEKRIQDTSTNWIELKTGSDKFKFGRLEEKRKEKDAIELAREKNWVDSKMKRKKYIKNWIIWLRIRQEIKKRQQLLVKLWYLKL